MQIILGCLLVLSLWGFVLFLVRMSTWNIRPTMPQYNETRARLRKIRLRSKVVEMKSASVIPQMSIEEYDSDFPAYAALVAERSRTGSWN